MGVLATATVDIVPNLKPLAAGLAQARTQLVAFNRDAGGGFGAAAGVGLSVGLGAALVGAAKKAASLNETMNKIKVTFGATASGGMIKQADELANRFGLVKNSTLEAAANFGLFGRAAGMSTDEAASFAKQLVQLGADLSSFHNISREAAFEKLEAGLAGQVRPLRSLGIFLSESAVKAKAAALGLGQVGRELTDQEKIQSRFSLIVEQSSLAHGDLARTIGETENQLKKAQGDLENWITQLGKDLEPALLSSISLAREFGETLQKTFAQKTGKGVFGDAASDLNRAVNELRDMNAILKSNLSLWEKFSGISKVLFPPAGGAAPGALAASLATKPTPSVPTAAEIREGQVAGTMADIAAAQRRAMPPSLQALAEAEIGPEESAADKRAEKRERTLSAHMRRIQAEQDRALSESLGGVGRGPQGTAAVQRDLANRIIERVSGPGLLNTLRDLTGGPINALMGGGVGGMALATGLQAAQAGLEKAGPGAFGEQPIRRPSTMFADPADFAREAITGVLSVDPDKKELLETQKQAAKDLEQIKEDVREGIRNIGRGFRGLFPRG